MINFLILLKCFEVRRLKENILLIISKLDSFCPVTIDGLASTATNSYFESSIHYVDQNLLMQIKYLSLRYTCEAKAVKFLYNKLKSIFEEWKIIETLFGITSDSGASILKGVMIQQRQVHCTGNRLNLCVHDLFKEIEIKQKINSQSMEAFFDKIFSEDDYSKITEINSFDKKRIEKQQH